MENDSLATLADILGDVHLLASFFKEKLASESEPKEGIQATIFRVPENIRRTNACSFEPKMVSLGPYHHGKQRFRATDERIKLPCATNFFRRSAGMNLVQRTVDRFKDWEADLRCAYSEQISMSSDEFQAMMMLDCAFMAEFLREQATGCYGTQKEEYLWKWAAPSIVNDMLVVENQLPLRPVLYLLNERADDNRLLTEFLCHDLMLLIHRNLSPPLTSTSYYSTSNICTLGKSAHLLHLFHGWLVIQLGRKANHLDNVDLPSFPSAEMLEAMRIRFTNKTDGSSFLDITFDESKRSMEIPQLIINDDNISLLRNLIAFEQECHGVGYCISTYVWFMDCLINTDKDVAVLRKHKIIVSRLRNDEEVAHIFNELRRTDAPVVDFDHFYLAEVMNNVQSYSGNRWNRLWGLWNFSWLRQNYFRNRWVTIVVAVAIFFNLLTLVQTVYAVLSYRKQ